MGLRRLRDQPRLGAYRPPLGRRSSGGVGLGGGYRRALGPLILLLAPARDHGLELNMNKPDPVESASALIDASIQELGDWRGKALAKLRKLIHKADPEIVEEWKWRGTP